MREQLQQPVSQRHVEHDIRRQVGRGIGVGVGNGRVFVYAGLDGLIG
jgi:hypothetical protein